MDYTPWLNDDFTDLIAPSWQSGHHKYVDVTLTLQQVSRISRVSLYDDKGMFTTNPVEVFALNGTEKTFLGKFTGEFYQEWINIAGRDLEAGAIILRKFGNEIPLKIKVFGTPAGTQTAIKSGVNPAASEMGTASAGEEQFSKVAGLKNAAVDWLVYPNPTPDKVEIALNQDITGEVIIDLLDNNGKILNHVTLQKKDNFLTQSFSLTNLKNGIYIIQLRAQGVREEKKIIKQ